MQDHRRGQLDGGLRRDPIRELVRLVHHEHLVLGQHPGCTVRGDPEHRVVRHDHVCLVCPAPGRVGEALRDRRAALAEALHGRERDLAPRAVRHARDEVVAVAGGGLRRPLAHREHLAAEVGRLRLGVLGGPRHVAEVEQRGGLVGRVAARQLVPTHVVVPALEQRDLRGPRQLRGHGGRHQRQVARHHLTLQRERGRRDHDALVREHRVAHRGHQVGQRLAGAGAGLDEQVLAGLDGRRDGDGHHLLPVAPHPSEGTDRVVEQLGHVHPGSLGDRVQASRTAHQRGAEVARD